MELGVGDGDGLAVGEGLGVGDGVESESVGRRGKYFEPRPRLIPSRFGNHFEEASASNEYVLIYR